MTQGTDLFNSSKGQFNEYSTLIGGEPPKTDNWFIEEFNNIDNISTLDPTMFSFLNGSVYPSAQEQTPRSFVLTQNETLKDCVEILDFNTGSNVTDFTISVFGRAAASNTFIFGQIDNSAHELRIWKRVSGVNTELAVPASVPNLEPSTQYWLVLITVGNIIRCEFWFEDPRTATYPISQTTHELAGSDATTFNVASSVGVWNWVPMSLNACINSVEVGNAFYDVTESINNVIAQKHVDIRDFINYRYPTRYRTMKELNDFHITEKAFSQNITLIYQAWSGTFNVLFYPADANPYIPIAIGPFAYDSSDATIKNKLNTELNKLPKFSITTDDPVKNVVSKISASDKTMMVEFNESFGSISLLQIQLDSLGRQVTFNDSSNTITLEGHIYANDNVIRFSNLDGTSGISLDVDYYIINKTDNTFQISTSLGGSAVNFIGDGTGTEILKGKYGSIRSDESYDAITKIGMLVPNIFDNNNFIETADPLNKSLTLDDLRVEQKFKNENWTLYRGNNASLEPIKSHFRDGDLIIGKVSSKGNLRGATLDFSRAISKIGGNWSVFLQSSWNSINCTTIGSSADLKISIVFNDFPWDPSSHIPVIDVNGSGCYVQFTSDPKGSFADQNGDIKNDSNKIYLDATTLLSEVDNLNAEFVSPMSAFETAYPEFNFARITGVRIFFKGTTSSSSSLIRVMSIRAKPNSHTWTSLNINTIDQTVCEPVLGFQESKLEIPSMLRGASVSTLGSDVRPIDSRQSIMFQTGLGDGGDYNKIMIFAREQEYNSLHRSMWLTVEYGFTLDDSYLHRYSTLRVLSDDGADALYWDIHGGGFFEDVYDVSQSGLSYLPLLNSEENYEFSAIFQGNSIGVQIQELTAAEQPQRIIYDAPIVSGATWSTIGGRVGWYGSVSDKDMSISSFNLGSASYANLVTKPFISETPIEGAQLFTVDSGDKNIFERFFPLSQSDTVQIDNQKTVSGEGSYVFESFGIATNPGAISNQFTVNDWNHIYIEFDIWIPKTLNKNEIRPKLMLRPAEQPEGTSGNDVFSGVVPSYAPVAFDFIPSSWSHVTLDLRGSQAKNGEYFLVILSDGDGNIEQSYFRNKWWIDNVKINTQTIEWEMRSIENGSWTPFRRNVNRQYGGLHLPETQIGRHLQLQAKALTEDAWIAEYTLIPKYSSIGKMPSTYVYMLENEIQ